jgi:hypothetical protein
LHSRPTRERSIPKFDPFFGEHEVGQPNPEQHRLCGPQIVLLLISAVGFILFIVLIAMLFYWPSIA